MLIWLGAYPIYLGSVPRAPHVTRDDGVVMDYLHTIRKVCSLHPSVGAPSPLRVDEVSGPTGRKACEGPVSADTFVGPAFSRYL